MSGTRCGVGTNSYSTGSPIVEAKVYINDVVVKTWVYQSQVYNVAMATYFDSTHFTDGTSITVKMTVKLADGKTGEDSTTIGVVYNRGLAYGVYVIDSNGVVFDSGATIAASHMQSMNHSVPDVQSDTPGNFWHEADLTGRASLATALHISAHGTGAPALYNNLSYEYTSPSEFLRCTCTPPMNIALLSACCLSVSNSPNPNGFAEALLAGGYGVNQACVSFREYIDMDDLVAYADSFWGALAGGKTAHEARDAMCDTVYDDDNDGHSDRPATDIAACWGDFYATLHRLYTGNDQSTSAIWHD